MRCRPSAQHLSERIGLRLYGIADEPVPTFNSLCSINISSFSDELRQSRTICFYIAYITEQLSEYSMLRIAWHLKTTSRNNSNVSQQQQHVKCNLQTKRKQKRKLMLLANQRFQSFKLKYAYKLGQLATVTINWAILEWKIFWQLELSANWCQNRSKNKQHPTNINNCYKTGVKKS